jgi:hypothetical protein
MEINDAGVVSGLEGIVLPSGFREHDDLLESTEFSPIS